MLALCLSCTRDVPVQIPFVAQLDGEAFSCRNSYKHVGRGGDDFTLQDLRFYVHDVRLLRADGSDIAVQLTDDGAWQHDGVVLVDFEDGADNCENGTTGTHTVLSGRVPRGEYSGLRFTLGVPFALNHANAATAPPPLNLGGMHWDWQAGYKFLRFEGATTAGAGYRVHLGSTGCEGSIGHITRCTHPNRVTVRLTGFQPDHSRVRVDLGALLADVDLHAPPGDVTRGCLSAQDDPDCAAPFAALGLDLSTGEGTGKQRVFSVM